MQFKKSLNNRNIVNQHFDMEVYIMESYAFTNLTEMKHEIYSTKLSHFKSIYKVKQLIRRKLNWLLLL